VMSLVHRRCGDSKAAVRRGALQLLEALLVMRASWQVYPRQLPSSADLALLEAATTDPLVSARMLPLFLAPSTPSPLPPLLDPLLRANWILAWDVVVVGGVDCTLCGVQVYPRQLPSNADLTLLEAATADPLVRPASLLVLPPPPTPRIALFHLRPSLPLS
jgi:hypothetical protein